LTYYYEFNDIEAKLQNTNNKQKTAYHE